MCVSWNHLSLTGRDEWRILHEGLAVAFRKAGAKSFPLSVRTGQRLPHMIDFGANKYFVLVTDCTCVFRFWLASDKINGHFA
jgi:hypothetical protein